MLKLKKFSTMLMVTCKVMVLPTSNLLSGQKHIFKLHMKMQVKTASN